MKNGKNTLRVGEIAQLRNPLLSQCCQSLRSIGIAPVCMLSVAEQQRIFDWIPERLSSTLHAPLGTFIATAVSCRHLA